MLKYALTHWRINKQGFENVVKPSWLNALRFVLFFIFLFLLVHSVKHRGN